MGLECPGSGEFLPAFLAPEGFLTCVHAEVSLQVVFQTKSNSTHLADERFFPRVDDAVLHQSSFELERLAAVRAPERALV